MTEIRSGGVYAARTKNFCKEQRRLKEIFLPCGFSAREPLASSEARLRACNPQIAARNPRPSVCAGRGASGPRGKTVGGHTGGMKSPPVRYYEAVG